MFTSQESLRQECQRQTPSLHQFPVFCLNVWLVDEQENRRDWQWASQQVDRPESNLWMLSLRFRAEGPSAIIRWFIDGDDENTQTLNCSWLTLRPFLFFIFYDLASSRVTAMRVMCLSVHISHYGTPRCENPWYTYCRASSGVSRCACCRAPPASCTSSCAAFELEVLTLQLHEFRTNSCSYVSPSVHFYLSWVHWVRGQTTTHCIDI